MNNAQAGMGLGYLGLLLDGIRCAIRIGYILKCRYRQLRAFGSEGSQIMPTL